MFYFCRPLRRIKAGQRRSGRRRSGAFNTSVGLALAWTTVGASALVRRNHGLLNMNWGKRKRGALKVGLLPRGRDPKHRERPGTFCSIEEITGLAQGRVRLPRRAEGCGRSGRRSVAWPWYQKGTCCALTTELHGLALARRGAARGALGQHDVEFASLTHPS